MTKAELISALSKYPDDMVVALRMEDMISEDIVIDKELLPKEVKDKFNHKYDHAILITHKKYEPKDTLSLAAEEKEFYDKMAQDILRYILYVNKGSLEGIRWEQITMKYIKENIDHSSGLLRHFSKLSNPDRDITEALQMLKNEVQQKKQL